MSKIQEYLTKLRSSGIEMQSYGVVDSFSIRDIKEYLLYLEYELKRKDNTIKTLIEENAILQVKLDKGVIE